MITSTDNGERKQYNSEQTAIYSLFYFNSILLLYNILFFVYAAMAYHMDERNYLITFLSALAFLQTLFLTNFTMRYYELAYVIEIYFSHDFEMALK